MPKPLAPNEVYQIVGQVYDHMLHRMREVCRVYPVPERHAALTDEQRQFVADCVKSVIAEIDYVLSPVPDEDEIEATPAEKTA